MKLFITSDTNFGHNMMKEQHLLDEIEELQEEITQLKLAKARFHLLPVANKQVYHRGLTILPFRGAAWVEVEFIERREGSPLYPAVVRMYYEDDKTKQALMVYERHCSKEDADAMLRLYG